MPTYEYECRECSYTFEAFQSINDAPIKTCPLCGGEVKRLIGGGSGVIFKGSGFYVTDSKKTQSASTGTKKTNSSTDNSSSSSGSADGGSCGAAAEGASGKAG
ncbi:MAG: FmdB family zinc ribbon protein [Rectinema sp.]|jgi:putative FmdB family regulatory protein